MIELLREEPCMTRFEASRRLGVSESSVYREIRKLEEDGRIRREGSRKTGHWEVLS